MSSLQGVVQGAEAALRVQDAQLIVHSEQTDIVNIPVELVLNSELSVANGQAIATIHFLAPSVMRGVSCGCVTHRSPGKVYRLDRERWRKRSSDPHMAQLELGKVQVRMPAAQQPTAAQWLDELNGLAYPYGPARRRILVVCNPVGGQGFGKRALRKIVLPILEAAGCKLTTILTKKRRDAFVAAHDINVQDYDALVCVGGDGTVHEIVNGLAAREDAIDALHLPLVPVPCGSGNGMFVSLHGATTLNVALACLSALKGRGHAQELCVVTQDAALFPEKETIYPIRGTGEGGKAYVQYYSFLSQAIGLMADIDLGTEHLRFLGDLRFSLSYLSGVVFNKKCDINIEVFLGSRGGTNKARMRARALSEAPSAVDGMTRPDNVRRLKYGSVMDTVEHVAKPLHLSDASEGEPNAQEEAMAGWQQVPVAVSSLYCGKMPYVARSFMAFPYALPSDGAMDILIQKQNSTTLQKVSSLLDGEAGDHVFNPSIRYFKVEACRVTPKTKGTHRTGYLSIDGERVPYAPFQVEVSPLSLQLLSLDDEEWKAPILHPPAVRQHEARRPSK